MINDQHFRIGLFSVILLWLLMVTSSASLGDVVVTKTGIKYEGKVELQNNIYVITDENGRQYHVHPSNVKEIIKPIDPSEKDAQKDAAELAALGSGPVVLAGDEPESNKLSVAIEKQTLQFVITVSNGVETDTSGMLVFIPAESWFDALRISGVTMGDVSTNKVHATVDWSKAEERLENWGLVQLAGRVLVIPVGGGSLDQALLQLIAESGQSAVLGPVEPGALALNVAKQLDVNVSKADEAFARQVMRRLLGPISTESGGVLLLPGQKYVMRIPYRNVDESRYFMSCRVPFRYIPNLQRRGVGYQLDLIKAVKQQEMKNVVQEGVGYGELAGAGLTVSQRSAVRYFQPKLQAKKIIRVVVYDKQTQSDVRRPIPGADVSLFQGLRWDLTPEDIAYLKSQSDPFSPENVKIYGREAAQPSQTDTYGRCVITNPHGSHEEGNSSYRLVVDADGYQSEVLDGVGTQRMNSIAEVVVYLNPVEVEDRLVEDSEKDAIGGEEEQQPEEQQQTTGDGSELYLIRVKNLFGYMDGTGKVVIEPKYLHAWDFYDGHAYVAIEDTSRPVIHGSHPTRRGYIDTNDRFTETEEVGVQLQGLKTSRDRNHYTVYTDRSGREYFRDRVPPQALIYYEGLAAVRRKYTGAEDRKGLPESGWGFVDRSGKLVINYLFLDVGNFSEGVARAKTSLRVPSGEMYDTIEAWGYIDRAGKFVIDARYREVKDFHEGVAAVRYRQDDGPTGHSGRWFLIDKTGKVVLPKARTIYGEVEGFSEGLLAEVNTYNPGNNQLTYWLDHDGNVVLDEYPGCGYAFKGGLARLVYTPVPNYPNLDEWAYINKQGEFVWSSNMDMFRELMGSRFKQVGEVVNKEFKDTRPEAVKQAMARKRAAKLETHIEQLDLKPISDAWGMRLDAFSSDERVGLMNSRPKVRVIDMTSGRRIGEVAWPEGEVSVACAGFSDDGKMLGLAFSEKVLVTEVGPNGLTGGIRTIECGLRPQLVRFIENNTQLVVADWAQIYVIDVASGDRLREISGFRGPFVFGPNGQNVFGTEGADLIAFDFNSGHERLRMKGHSSSISAIAISADGSRAATASHDLTIRVWDLESGEQVKRFDVPGTYRKLWMSHDGRFILVEHGVGLIDCVTGEISKVVPTDKGLLRPDFISPDGKRLIFQERTKAYAAMLPDIE